MTSKEFGMLVDFMISLCKKGDTEELLRILEKYQYQTQGKPNKTDKD